MKARRSLVVVLLLVGSLALVASISGAQEALPKASSDLTQRLVRVRVDGASFLLVGDPLVNTDKAFDGGALPALQQRGWRIVSVHMTAAAGTVSEQ